MIRSFRSHLTSRSLFGSGANEGFWKVKKQFITSTYISHPNKCYGQLLFTRHGHTVRIILTEDMPNGKGFKNEIHNVRAGYARNYLIPQKIAVYATPEKFKKLGIQDPEKMTLSEKKAKALEEANLLKEDEKDIHDKREADILRKYLRNKELKIWRRADAGTGRTIGMVNARIIREKLGIQLKIDLEPHELVVLRPNMMDFDTIEDLDQFVMETSSSNLKEVIEKDDNDGKVRKNIEDINASITNETNDNAEDKTKSDSEHKLEEVAKYDDSGDQKANNDETIVLSDEELLEGAVEVRQLGMYLAEIHLSGDHIVPLKVNIVKR